MAKTLTHFSVTPSGDDYLLTIEDEDGGSSEFTASFDQLDVITEAIEEALDQDEEQALSADEAEEEEE